MDYTLFRQQALPKFITARSSSSSNYRNEFDEPGHMEITTIDMCGVYLIQGEKRTFVPARSVIVAMPDSRFSLVAAEEGILCDDMISAEIPGQSFVTLREERIRGSSPQGRELLLPMAMPLGDDFVGVSRLIRTFISLNSRDTENAFCMRLALWFELLATLDSLSRNVLFNDYSQEILPSHQMYIRKAKHYITRHFSEQIQNTDIAESLGITPNYLSNIFRQATGTTLHGFLITTRLEQAKELLERHRDIPVEEIAERSGFRSARTLALHFKKEFGITVGEFLRMNRAKPSSYAVPPREL